MEEKPTGKTETSDLDGVEMSFNFITLLIAANFLPIIFCAPGVDLECLPAEIGTLDGIN